MTAVLAGGTGTRSRRSGSGGGLKFRFSDLNPLTGRAYAQSRFDDLPLLIGDVAESLGLPWGRWNTLVEAGEIGEHIDTRRVRPLPHTLGGDLRTPRTGQPPADKCGDCWGTCVDIDHDGSFTGVVGASFVCICSR